ncbi:hypothetical protein ACSVDE_12650 [Pseudalkalibacillus sp. Hm43]|uniref:hypothetical protein n=1 Tax=Pseudalkalibacillus sp. Hm43 TaxID=3450742 RepID=UPI003F442495
MKRFALIISWILVVYIVWKLGTINLFNYHLFSERYAQGLEIQKYFAIHIGIPLVGILFVMVLFFITVLNAKKR